MKKLGVKIKNREELKESVTKILTKSAHNEIAYVLDFNVTDLRNLYLILWNSFPETTDFSGDWKISNKNIYKKCEDYLMPFAVYNGENNNKMAPFYVGERIIVGFHSYGVYVLSDSKEDAMWVKKYTIDPEKKKDIPKVYWVSASQAGFEKTLLDIKKPKLSIKTGYNDDLDYEKVKKFINSDESGLMILHGQPGTGKTFFLRHIASTFKKKDYLFIDGNMLSQINSSAFLNFLKNNENSVIVLEDCEVLLQERVNASNNLLTTLLNLADGILGDGLKIKFICTFNADLGKIDSAILRKGRLKYMYEFKPLVKEKAIELAKSIGVPEPDKDTPLCDIYNQDTNGTENKTKKTIGF